MRTTWRWSAVLWLAAVVGAQTEAPLRMPHRGRVTDAKQEPLADAVVVFVSLGSSGDPSDGDVVRATTDARGEFRLLLQRGLRYDAWAASTGAAGTHTSPRVPRGAVSTQLQIDRSAKAAPTRFTVSGAAAWREHGALRARLRIAGCASPVADMVLDADGAMALPPLPANTAAEVAVFAGDRVVYGQIVRVDEPLRLPPPRRIAVCVCDDRGQPIAGVALDHVVQWSSYENTLSWSKHGERITIATTGADGMAELLIAHQRHVADLWKMKAETQVAFVAGKSGYRDCVFGFSNGFVVDGTGVNTNAAPGVVALRLKAQPGIRASVVAGAGPMPKELRLMSMLAMENQVFVLRACTRVPVAADGTVELPAAPRQWLRSVLRIGNLVPRLAADDPFRHAAVPQTLTLPASALEEPGALDLRRIVPLRLQLLDATAGPAMGVEVVCAPKSGGAFLAAAEAMKVTSDAGGRAVLPLMPGSWVVVALDGNTWASTELEVDRDLPPQTLHLAPLARMQVVVVDAAGGPIANARFDGSGWGRSGRGEALQSFLCEVGRAHAAKWLPQQSTDHRGRAVLSFLAAESQRVRFRARIGDRWSQEIDLVARDEVVEVVVK